MSAFAAIGSALVYDAEESMLAAGASLDDVLRFAVMRAESLPLPGEESEEIPVSFAPTVPACRAA